MATPQIEYLGFRSGDVGRMYRLQARHTDGRCDEFTFTIAQEAFLSGRARFQDGAEICFTKLLRAFAACEGIVDSPRPELHQSVTDAELLAYRVEHAPKPRRLAVPKPASAAPVAAPASDVRPN